MDEEEGRSRERKKKELHGIALMKCAGVWKNNGVFCF